VPKKVEKLQLNRKIHKIKEKGETILMAIEPSTENYLSMLFDFSA